MRNSEMGWANQTILVEFFLKDFLVTQGLSYSFFCANLNNVCGHPFGQCYPHFNQHLGLPPSHSCVLLPGEPLLGHLLHFYLHALYLLHTGELPLRKKCHLLPWMCSIDVPWLGYGDSSVCAPKYDGL